MGSQSVGAIEANLGLSEGPQSDSTTNTLAEIRASEKRHIPLDVMLKASDHYTSGRPVIVTVLITNLFDLPVLLNSRMLVNHPLLQGEVSFYIIDPSGQRQEIKRLITPLSVRDNDFVILNRGQSIQRSVDLADLYGIDKKGHYKLLVSYHNEVDRSVDSNRAWTGIVWSDPIEIRLD
jgi:hypothetical protein